MSKTPKLLAAALVLAAATQVAQGTTYVLADLISTGDSITIGDKIFDDFGLASSSVSIDAAHITVTPSITGEVYYLTFQGTMHTVDTDPDIDIGLFYSVATASGAAHIVSIDQAFNLTATGTGGTVAIGETVWDAGFFAGNVVAQSSVSFDVLGLDASDPPGELVQGDQLVINPAASKVWVTKDIFLNANPGGQVGATIVSQSFHQVPDGGGTSLLLGAALMGLGLIRRRMPA